jgi:8-oxo-dGTP diphosphatase
MADAKKVGTGLGVVLLKEGKILLGKRLTSELEGAESWTMPGGHIEFGESFEETAKREVLEETGIIVRAVRVFCVNGDRSERAHYVTVGAVAENFVGEPNVMEPDVITEWRWFPLDKLPDHIFMPSRNMLDCYLSQKVNKC